MKEGKQTLPTLAQPFGAVFGLVRRLMVEVPGAALGESARVAIRGRPPTVPQDEDLPGWAGAAGGRRATMPARARTFTIVFSPARTPAPVRSSGLPFENARFSHALDDGRALREIDRIVAPG